MAEINRIEIDGVEYKITAPREELNIINMNYSINYDNTYYVSFNQEYTNKNIIVNIDELVLNMGNSGDDIKFSIDVSNLKNCTLFIKNRAISLGTKCLIVIGFIGFKGLNYIVSRDEILIDGAIVGVDNDNADNYFDIYVEEMMGYKFVYKLDIDEYRYCDLKGYINFEV